LIICNESYFPEVNSLGVQKLVSMATQYDPLPSKYKEVQVIYILVS